MFLLWGLDRTPKMTHSMVLGNFACDRAIAVNLDKLLTQRSIAADPKGAAW